MWRNAQSQPKQMVKDGFIEPDISYLYFVSQLFEFPHQGTRELNHNNLLDPSTWTLPSARPEDSPGRTRLYFPDFRAHYSISDRIFRREDRLATANALLRGLPALLVYFWSSRMTFPGRSPLRQRVGNINKKSSQNTKSSWPFVLEISNKFRSFYLSFRRWFFFLFNMAEKFRQFRKYQAYRRVFHTKN